MAPKRGHEGRPVTIADLVGSDDEADEDFVPDEEEAPVPKRAKEAKPEPAKKEVREEPKEDIDALWSSFNAPTKPEAGPSKPKEEKVVREYQFAGKTVKHEVVKKKGLGAMAAGLSKPKKLTTLEKSKLDWNAHVADEDMGAELARQRKDGYLEKKDFLDRTRANASRG